MGGQSLFLLIILSALSNVTTENKMLNMAPNAVDDIFIGCRDKMLQAVTGSGGLMQRELEARKDFANMWKSHSGTCEKQIYGGTPFHLAALQAYGNSGPQFRKTFNNMVHTKGSSTNTYKDEFTFKSLHFLLTDAMQLLNQGHQCYTVYFGTNNQYTSEIGNEVRFGKFLHPRIQESSEIETAESGGEGTLFNITSCSVVNVENYTCTSEEVEQLISPTEVFRVQKIENISTDDGEYKKITLTHSRFLSNHDCYLFPRQLQGFGHHWTVFDKKRQVFILHSTSQEGSCQFTCGKLVAMSQHENFRMASFKMRETLVFIFPPCLMCIPPDLCSAEEVCRRNHC